ncbi:MAG: SMC-Scp complex subunit ScpB [Bacillota bacterium]|jgi:segregation and condensation protein B
MRENEPNLGQLKNIVEAVLFVATEPINAEQLVKICDGQYQEAEIIKIIYQLQADYEHRGIRLRNVAGGWQFFSAAAYHEYVAEYCLPKVQQLSQAALETLAIIAYRQPITRQEIEKIRQVNSDGIVNKLHERHLIKELGRKEVLGRPMLYGTTEQFLSFLGLNNLSELPSLKDFLPTKEG